MLASSGSPEGRVCRHVEPRDPLASANCWRRGTRPRRGQQDVFRRRPRSSEEFTRGLNVQAELRSDSRHLIAAHASPEKRSTLNSGLHL